MSGRKFHRDGGHRVWRQPRLQIKGLIPVFPPLRLLPQALLEQRGELPPGERHANGAEWIFWAEEPVADAEKE